MAVQRQAPVTKAAALPNRGAAAPTGRAVPNNPPDETPVTGGGSFANLFDQTPASSGFGIDVAPGKYECIITYAKLEPPTDKGTNVLIKYEVCDDGDAQGKTIPTYYRVIEADGKTVGKGMGILRKDLGVLGFPSVAGADVEDALKQLEEAMDGVALTVKQNGQYINAYLQGLVQNSEIIEAWKSTRPDQVF